MVETPIPGLTDHPDVIFCTFKKEDVLLAQGQETEYVFYLTAGTCYRTAITYKGDEIIYSVKKSGDLIGSIVGVLTLYGIGNKNTANFICQTHCEAYRIPKSVFFAYVDQRPDLLKDIIALALSEQRRLFNDFQFRQEGKVANRLCQLLLEHSTLCGEQLVVDKAYSNVELSRFLGIHTVTVSRIIKSLRAKEVVTRDKQGLTIQNVARLKAYAQGEKLDYE